MHKVLIAEDEALERQVLRYLVENSNLPVTVVGEAANGKETVKMVDTLKPDIVLMDIKMPGMDGLEATKRVKYKYPDIEVIIISAYGEFSYSQRAIKYQATDYLLKPVQPDELINTLKNACSKLDNRMLIGITSVESVPINASMLNKMVNLIFLNKPEQSKSVCQKIISTLLPVNEANRMLPSIAYKILVVTAQEIVNNGLPEDNIARVNKELTEDIKFLTSNKDLINWAYKMIDKFTLLCNQYMRNDEHTVIDRVKMYIQDNFHKEISLIQAASEVHLSPAYLSRIFKQKTKTSFSKYLTEYRIEEAKKLLSSTNMTIDEIAFSVGYNNNSYFTSVFKKYENLTPSEYRIKAKNNPLELQNPTVI